jgi:predicted kinase
MPTLTITRGLPGSGKTTQAHAWVAEDPAQRARVNRDDLRAMLHAGLWLGAPTERQIVAVRDAAITALLAAGVDVVSDDTNLDERTAGDLRALAELVGAGFEVLDLRHVPVEVCVRRDAARAKPVGEGVIRGMAAKHLDGVAECGPGSAGEVSVARPDDRTGADR